MAFLTFHIMYTGDGVLYQCIITGLFIYLFNIFGIYKCCFIPVVNNYIYLKTKRYTVIGQFCYDFMR